MRSDTAEDVDLRTGRCTNYSVWQCQGKNSQCSRREGNSRVGRMCHADGSEIVQHQILHVCWISHVRTNHYLASLPGSKRDRRVGYRWVGQVRVPEVCRRSEYRIWDIGDNDVLGALRQIATVRDRSEVLLHQDQLQLHAAAQRGPLV